MMKDLEAGDLLDRVVAQLRRPVGQAGFSAITGIQQAVVAESRHVHEHELEPAGPGVLPCLPGQVRPALRPFHHLIRRAVLDEDPPPIRPPPGHLGHPAFTKPHVRLVDPLIERGHLLVLGRGGCGVPLPPQPTEETPLPPPTLSTLDAPLAPPPEEDQQLARPRASRCAPPSAPT